MNTLTLAEVIAVLEDEKNKNNNSPKLAGDEFYRQQTKNFKDILNVLDLTEAIKDLKNKSGNYSFYEKDKDFLVKILQNYVENDFKKMRKGLFKEANSEYIVYIVEGFVEIIKKKIIDETKREEIILKMYNRTNYPLRKCENILFNLQDELKKIINYALEPKIDNFLPKQDQYTWLTAMQKDFRRFIQKWDTIHFNMQEERNYEINENAWNEASNMTKEEENHVMMRATIVSRREDILKEHEEYKKLSKRLAKLVEPQRGFIKDKEKEYERIVTKKNTILDEIWSGVNKELFPDTLLKNDEQLQGNKPDEMMIESNELLNRAIQEYTKEQEKLNS